MNVNIINQEQLLDLGAEGIIACWPQENPHKTHILSQFDAALHGNLYPAVKLRLHQDNEGKILVLPTSGFIVSKYIIMVGMGKESEVTADKLRSLVGTALQEANRLQLSSIALILPSVTGIAAEVVAEAMVTGAILGGYKFTYYKTGKDKQLTHVKQLSIVSDHSSPGLTAAVNRAEIIAAAVNMTRDLVNHPSQYMTPSKLAEQALDIGKQCGLDVTILTEREIEEQRMNALLAVAKGSEEPARCIVVEYAGNPDSTDKIAFVGKGITFDSGGISIKPSEGMEEMKDDMAGAAAVLGAVQAIALLQPKINIIVVMPCTENMPSGRALKPGDIIKTLNGKTVEILSTDAEGRLVLADAITYAMENGATRVVDIATLTGACVVALGKIMSGVITNNQEWCDKVLTASRSVGEKMWQLPGDPEYRELIKSDIADLKNSGGRSAGAITAGLFLAAFADSTPWVHIDIAGTVSQTKDKGYNPQGATGVGVRTLVQLALDLSAC